MMRAQELGILGYQYCLCVVVGRIGMNGISCVSQPFMFICRVSSLVDVLQLKARVKEPISSLNDFLSRVRPADVTICGVRFSDILDPNLEDIARVRFQPMNDKLCLIMRAYGL